MDRKNNTETFIMIIGIHKSLPLKYLSLKAHLLYILPRLKKHTITTSTKQQIKNITTNKNIKTKTMNKA